MLRDVKGGSAAVKDRVSLMLKEAADAVREELLGEDKKPDDTQQEVRCLGQAIRCGNMKV